METTRIPHRKLSDVLKEKGGKIEGALVTQVRDLAETDKNDLDAHAITIDIGEDERVDGTVQIEPGHKGYKPSRGDFLDIIADNTKGADGDTLPTAVPTEAADVGDEGSQG